MEPQQPTSYRGILPTISQYQPYRPQMEKFVPTPAQVTPMGDNGMGTAQQGIGALAQALGKGKGKTAPGTGSPALPSLAEASPFFHGGGAAGASFAPSATIPSMGAEVIPGATMSASFTPAAPTIGGSLGWGSAATMPSMGAAGGGAGASGGGAAMFSNPFTAIPAAIAANELTAHGTSRRPDGWGDQIKFDLMGKAPAADMHALSQKWNLGPVGDVLEGGARGASIDPSDWSKGVKQVAGGSTDIFNKGLSGLKSFFGW